MDEGASRVIGWPLVTTRCGGLQSPKSNNLTFGVDLT